MMTEEEEEEEDDDDDDDADESMHLHQQRKIAFFFGFATSRVHHIKCLSGAFEHRMPCIAALRCSLRMAEYQ